jgi:hypothetical protein
MGQSPGLCMNAVNGVRRRRPKPNNDPASAADPGVALLSSNRIDIRLCVYMWLGAYVQVEVTTATLLSRLQMCMISSLVAAKINTVD